MAPKFNFMQAMPDFWFEMVPVLQDTWTGAAQKSIYRRLVQNIEATFLCLRSYFARTQHTKERTVATILQMILSNVILLEKREFFSEKCIVPMGLADHSVLM